MGRPDSLTDDRLLKRSHLRDIVDRVKGRFYEDAETRSNQAWAEARKTVRGEMAQDEALLRRERKKQLLRKERAMWEKEKEALAEFTELTISETNLEPLESTNSTSKTRKSSQPPLDCLRAVALTGKFVTGNIPQILAQMCGGGLEKVVYDGKKPLLQVHFLKRQAAENFFNYAQTGLFIVNGRKLKCKWLHELSHSPRPKALPDYVTYEIKCNGASRVLVLARVVSVPAVLSDIPRRPQPEKHFQELNVEQVKWDLVQLGGIVDVVPLISRKVGIAVHFSDIRSAVLAMRAIKLKSSILHSKYYSWEVKYGKDPVDKPCFAV